METPALSARRDDRNALIMNLKHSSILSSILAAFCLNQGDCLCAQEQISAPPPVPMITRLPVTTGWLGNTLLRGGQADWSDKSQTYFQLYTSDMKGS